VNPLKNMFCEIRKHTSKYEEKMFSYNSIEYGRIYYLSFGKYTVCFETMEHVPDFINLLYLMNQNKYPNNFKELFKIYRDNNFILHCNSPVEEIIKIYKIVYPENAEIFGSQGLIDKLKEKYDLGPENILNIEELFKTVN